MCSKRRKQFENPTKRTALYLVTVPFFLCELYKIKPALLPFLQDAPVIAAL